MNCSVTGVCALRRDIVDELPMQLASSHVAALPQADIIQVGFADVEMIRVVLAPEVLVWALIHDVTVDSSISRIVVLEICRPTAFKFDTFEPAMILSK